MICDKVKTGYAGQRYEVRFDHDGKERIFGWTNSADGEPFISSIKAHPVWKNPRVIDLCENQRPSGTN